MIAGSKTHLSLLVCALCLVLPLTAAAQGAEDRDIIAATEKLFDAMRARDARALRALLHADVRIISVKPNGDLVVRTGEEWIRGIAASPVVPDERMRAPEVRIDGPFATLWATYTFHRGKEFSHCGVDAFQYVRGGEGWRLITIAFTSRTTGCSSGEQPAAVANVPPIPAPGRLVDLGGWRVHLHCTGERSSSRPTVILEAGAGGFSGERTSDTALRTGSRRRRDSRSRAGSGETSVSRLSRCSPPWMTVAAPGAGMQVRFAW